MTKTILRQVARVQMPQGVTILETWIQNNKDMRKVDSGNRWRAMIRHENERHAPPGRPGFYLNILSAGGGGVLNVFHKRTG